MIDPGYRRTRNQSVHCEQSSPPNRIAAGDVQRHQVADRHGFQRRIDVTAEVLVMDCSQSFLQCAELSLSGVLGDHAFHDGERGLGTSAVSAVFVALDFAEVDAQVELASG